MLVGRRYVVTGRVQRVGGMLTLFAEDTERYAALFRHLLDRGVYVAPSQFEAMFVSLAHGDEEVSLTVDAVGEHLGHDR